jgi:glucosamine-6-phosphate deaminase
MTTTARQAQAGKLLIRLHDTEEFLGEDAAHRTAAEIRQRVAETGTARIIIATGNSQLAFIRALRTQPDVPWSAVTVFHMDEYVGISASHPASFRRWIRENVEEALHPGTVHYIEGDAPDPVQEAARYEALLREAPLDLVCMGIGENGHLAFNEPGAADFNDAAWAKIITLTSESILQQVGEGHFPTAADVPVHAISLTIPALLAPRAVHVAVPERRKAAAVRAALTEPVSNLMPASILREQEHAVLFLDADSASQLDGVLVGN